MQDHYPIVRLEIVSLTVREEKQTIRERSNYVSQVGLQHSRASTSLLCYHRGGLRLLQSHPVVARLERRGALLIVRDSTGRDLETVRLSAFQPTPACAEVLRRRCSSLAGWEHPER